MSFISSVRPAKKHWYLIMNKLLLLPLLIFPYSAFSETYLCIAEAGAAVESTGIDNINAELIDISSQKLIQTNESGKWIIKPLGKDFVLFDNCRSLYFCEQSKSYAGVFMRNKDDIFTVTWLPFVENKDVIAIAKGRCSKL
jgi:hypothetical protein